MLSRRSTTLLLTALFAALTLGDLEGGKPSKPPPAPIDGGLVYFSFGGNLYTMNPDGSSKTLAIAGFPECAEPSRHLHGGSRWFLITCAVNPPDEVNPGDTYPDGRQRFELFAVSEAGDRIRLSDDPTLQPFDPSLAAGETEARNLSPAAPRWALEDTIVSYCGRRWDAASGTVVETGIYAIEVGDVSLFSQAMVPSRLPIALPEIQTDYGLWFPCGGMDWAPDASRIVYMACNSGLWVANVSEGSQVRLLEHCLDEGNPYCYCWDYSSPRWSPNGSRIAFTASVPDGSGGISAETIETMAPDGSGRKVIVSGKRGSAPGIPENPLWSPAGTHIVYQRVRLYASVFRTTWDIYRSTASGTDSALLTGDVDGWVQPGAWVPGQ